MKTIKEHKYKIYKKYKYDSYFQQNLILMVQTSTTIKHKKTLLCVIERTS